MALRKRVVTFKICFRKKGYLERGGETMNIYIYIYIYIYIKEQVQHWGVLMPV